MKDNGFSQIFKLMQENHDLPILPMVDYEVVAGDEYTYWAGSWGEAEVKEFIIDDWYGDGCIRFKDDSDYGDLIEGYAEKMFGDCENDENWKKAEEYIESHWIKAIVVYIGVGDPEELRNG